MMMPEKRVEYPYTHATLFYWFGSFSIAHIEKFYKQFL